LNFSVIQLLITCMDGLKSQLLVGAIALAFITQVTTAIGQSTTTPSTSQAPAVQIAPAQPLSSQTPTAQTQPANDLQQLQTDLKKLQSDTQAQNLALDTLKKYAELGAALFTVLGVIIAGVSVVAIILQVLGFRVEAHSRAKDEELGRRFEALLNLAMMSARDAQEKVKNLEEGGIQKASQTLQLINNLLQITERAAAKAASTQFDFWSKSIENFDK
jgi:hypothetical protein